MLTSLTCCLSLPITSFRRSRGKILKWLGWFFVRDRGQKIVLKLGKTEKIIVFGLHFRRRAMIGTQPADQFIVGIENVSQWTPNNH